MEVGVGVGEVLEESVDGLEGQQRDAGLVGELAVLTAGVYKVGRFLPPSLHKYNWLQLTLALLPYSIPRCWRMAVR